MSAERPKLPVKFEERATLKPITEDKIRRISESNSQKTAGAVLKRISGNKGRAGRYYVSKLQRIQSGNLARESQPRRFDVAEPDSSIRRPLTTS